GAHVQHHDGALPVGVAQELPGARGGTAAQGEVEVGAGGMQLARFREVAGAAEVAGEDPLDRVVAQVRVLATADEVRAGGSQRVDAVHDPVAGGVAGEGVLRSGGAVQDPPAYLRPPELCAARVTEAYVSHTARLDLLRVEQHAA